MLWPHRKHAAAEAFEQDDAASSNRGRTNITASNRALVAAPSWPWAFRRDGCGQKGNFNVDHLLVERFSAYSFEEEKLNLNYSLNINLSTIKRGIKWWCSPRLVLLLNRTRWIQKSLNVGKQFNLFDKLYVKQNDFDTCFWCGHWIASSCSITCLQLLNCFWCDFALTKRQGVHKNIHVSTVMSETNALFDCTNACTNALFWLNSMFN